MYAKLQKAAIPFLLVIDNLPSLNRNSLIVNHLKGIMGLNVKILSSSYYSLPISLQDSNINNIKEISIPEFTQSEVEEIISTFNNNERIINLYSEAILSLGRFNPAIISALYAEKRIELIGGLKINFRTYINDFLPEVEIVNSDGHESVYLQYKGTDEKIYLHQKQALNSRWLLPEKTAISTDFYIKVEDENFSGNELAYNLISSNNTAIQVGSSKLPKRDSFGRSITTNVEQYCLGSNIVNPMISSKRYSCALSWIFTPINQDATTSISTIGFDNHNGNNLCNFLSLKGTLTTEDFFKAFEFYYSKEFSEHQIDSNINLTKLKRASLTFYDFIGVLDYNYETKNIVLNPPQLIFIPATQGRRVLLIGARDTALIESIINTAPTYNLQVEITKQYSSNERLLLPDVITIKAFGTSSEKYGEKNIKELADKLKITFSNEYFPQLALQHFSANITDYENTMQNIDENDYDWARYIFDPETLRFEKSETENFNKSFSMENPIPIAPLSLI